MGGTPAHEIVSSMRKVVNGTFVETYGGPIGWVKFRFWGNIAYDGVASGPILLNRIPLKHRGYPDIANTLAHEISHRAGLSHPSSNKDLSIAEKEPPYVIGDIVEELVLKQVVW